MNIVLFRPKNPADTVHLEYAGGGLVLETFGAELPNEHHLGNAQEAKEFIIQTAWSLLNMGYRVYTGEVQPATK